MATKTTSAMLPYTSHFPVILRRVRLNTQAKKRAQNLERLERNVETMSKKSNKKTTGAMFPKTESVNASAMERCSGPSASGIAKRSSPIGVEAASAVCTYGSMEEENGDMTHFPPHYPLL